MCRRRLCYHLYKHKVVKKNAIIDTVNDNALIHVSEGFVRRIAANFKVIGDERRRAGRCDRKRRAKSAIVQITRIDCIVCAQTQRGDFKCDRVVADQLSFPLPPKKLSPPPPAALMPDVVPVPTKVSA
jgi:hypothetical protein